MRAKLPHFIPVLVLLGLIGFVYFTNIHNEFTLEHLIQRQQSLIAFNSIHPFYFQFCYMAIYILSVWLAIPDSTILTLIAGMILPLPLALFYAALAEMMGSLLFFWTFVGAFKQTLPSHEFSFLHKLRLQFNRAPRSYLLFLRVSHILPFWIVSLAGAYFKVRTWTFAWTTFLGSLPFCYVFAVAGHSLNKLFAQNNHPTISDIFTPTIKISLLALSLFALFPLIYNKYKGKKNE